MNQGQTRSGVLRGAQAVVLVFYAILMTYVAILLLAFFLQLFGANPAASFVDWVYTAAARIMQPFRGMFPSRQVSSDSVFDASVLFAVIVYWLAALLLHAAVDWLSDRVHEIKQRQVRASVPPQQQVDGQPGFGSPAYGDVRAPSPGR